MEESTTSPEEKLKKAFIDLTILALEATVDDKATWPAILIEFHNLMKTVK